MPSLQRFRRLAGRWMLLALRPGPSGSDRRLIERLENRLMFSASPPSGWDVALIDKTLPDRSALIRAMEPGGRVILYDGRRDSARDVLGKVLDWAHSSGAKIQSLSLLAHGSPGWLELGTQWVSSNTLKQTSGAWAALGRVMAPGGAINLYGCSLADPSGDGQALINKLSALTGVSVFATTHRTGHDGSWVLDASSRAGAFAAGSLIARAPMDNGFDASILQTWPDHLFAAPAVSRSAVGTAGRTSLPLSFEPNQGQTDPQVDYLARGSGYTTFLSHGGAVLNLQNGNQGDVVRLNVVGGNANPTAAGSNPQAGYSNYLGGNGSITQVPHLGSVSYANVYDGIGLRYYGNQRQLEYDFIVSPGVDASIIHMQVQGATAVTIDSAGNLVLQLGAAGQNMSFLAPVAYQWINGRQVAVQSHYTIDGTGNVGFSLGDYDHSGALVIDPVLSYGTFIGGTGLDSGNAIAVDSTGSAYVTGETASADFPATAGAYNSSINGSSDVFVAKLNPAGTALAYSTFIGGSNTQAGYGIAIDSSGEAYVTGATTSGTFPRVNAYDTHLKGSSDAFLLKLSADGSSLLYSTLIGGGQDETGLGIALDSSGDAYIAGNTDSTDNFSTVGAAQTSVGAGSAGFVAKFDPSVSGVSSLIYCTYVDSTTGDTFATAIAVDSSNRAYVTGYSTSSSTTFASAYQPTPGGGTDAYIAEYNSNGSGFVTNTYFGGPGNDYAYGIALGASNNVYITGEAGAGLPTSGAAFQTVSAGGQDAFVARFDLTQSGSSALVYSTYLGGSGDERGNAIAVDENGNAWITGSTTSHDMPTAGAALDTSLGGSQDAFVAKFTSSGAALDYAAYLGGSGQDLGNGVALYGTHSLLVTGDTNSSGFPTTAGAYDALYNGGGDAFVNDFAINTAPALSGANALSAINEGDVTSTGTLVSSLIAGKINDADAGDPQGIAVTAVDTSHGAWQYSTNSGSTWNDFTSPSGANATLLAADPTTYVRFKPNALWYGTVAAGLTFRAWDQSAGSAGGSADTTSNGGETAFSAAAASASIAVNEVNQAPALQVPTARQTSKNTSLVFSVANSNAIQVSDLDSNGGSEQVTLAVTNGLFTLAATTGLSISPGSGTGDASDTFSGSIASINAALDGLLYAPSNGYGGAASLSISINDLGNSGSGGPKSASSSVAIAVGTAAIIPSTGNITTTDAGGSATFTVVLNTKPTASVSFGVSSSDTSAGTVSPSSLTFTAANWNTPQTVTVTGVTTAIAQGNRNYQILFSGAASADPGYGGLTGAPVAATDIDANMAGIRITPTSAQSTTEAGGTATFTVVLSSQPTAAVSIPLSSSDTTEGVLSASSATFTAANWNVPQIVTVTGVDDGQYDAVGDTYAVLFGPAVSSDGAYNGISPASLTISNVANTFEGPPLGAESRISPSSVGIKETDYQSPHAVAMDSNGNYVITWSDNNSGQSYGVRAQRYNALGQPVGNSTQQVNTYTNDDQRYSDVAMDAAGDYVITWSSHGQDGDGWGIYAQRYTSAGQALGGEFRVNSTTTGDQMYSDVAMDASGSFVITWTSNGQDGSGAGIYAQRYNSSGQAGGGEFLVNSTTTGDQNYSSVSSDPSGNFVVTWSSYGQDGSGWGTYAQRYNASGIAQGSETLINDVTGGDQEYSRVAVDGSGNYTIVYASSGQDGDGFGIYSRRYDSSGNALGGSSLVNSAIAGDQTFPTIGMDSAGNAVVTWSDSQNDGAGWGVYGQRFNGTGARQGFNFLVNTTVTGDQHYSSVALSPLDRFVVVWSGNGTGDANGVYAQAFDGRRIGVLVTPTSGLTTTQSGGSDTFQVALNSQPAGNVTMNFASSNTAIGTLSTSSLVFTSANWNSPQTITVTGVMNPVDGGNQSYLVVSSSTTSSDPDYNGLSVPNVSITSLDTYTAGISVSPTSGLVTIDTGGTATFQVVLTSQPTASVSVPLASSDSMQGVTDLSSLTFTAANWNTPRTVTVTGVNNHVANGDQVYLIQGGPAVSSDPKYNNIVPASVSLTNSNTNVAGVHITPTSGLATTQAGGTASFSVVLTSVPSANVIIPLASSDTNQGTLSVSSLTFTPANWNAPQAVTVTGHDDQQVQGNVAYQINTGPAQSGDPQYSALATAAVSLVNHGTDTAGIVVTPTSGLSTTVGGGTATFQLVLATQPTADVTVPLSSSNLNEGVPSVASVTFTAANWNVPQIVTVTGVNDFVADGNSTYSIVPGAVQSADSNYAGIAVSSVMLNSIDTNVAGVTVTPTSGLITTVGGGIAIFQMVLTSKPLASVLVGLASSAPNEGVPSVSSLTFTAGNWNMPQTVTITGVDDHIADGNQGYTIVTATATSGDAGYNGLNPADVSLTSIDSNSPGVVVTPTTGLTTTVLGGTASFQIVLASKPIASVTIPLSSSDPNVGVPNLSSVTLTPANWNVPQVVTVMGLNDFIANGNIAYQVTTGPAQSADPNYNGMNTTPVSLTSINSNTAGVAVTPTLGLTTTVTGGTATFQIVLLSKPTANVTLPLSSSALNEGILSVSSIVFTPANWNTPQAITVTGVNDFVADGNTPYTVAVGPAISGDPTYNGYVPSSVSLSSIDSNVAGIAVTPTTGLVTDQAGGSATFQLVLTSEPLADVTIPLASSDTTQGTLSASSITFTPADWNTPRTIQVTGQDDHIVQGDQAYAVNVGPAQSADANYDQFPGTSVSLINRQRDAVGVVVTPSSGLTTTVTGGQATFTVVLSTEPLADVILPLLSTDPDAGVTDVSSLRFTASNWNIPQNVTITGVNDYVADGNQNYSIITGPAESTDMHYDGYKPTDVSATSLNSNSAGITVTPVSGLTTTALGGTASFRIALASAPLADVTVPISSSDPTEGLASATSLTFASANWNIPRTVTMMGRNDGTSGGVAVYAALIGPAGSADPAYNGARGPSVSISNSRDVAPELDVTDGAVNDFEAAEPLDVDPGISIVPGTSTVLSGAMIAIADYMPGQEVLAFSPTRHISGSWDAAAGVLTLGGVAGTAEYQAALRGITYENDALYPYSATRAISFTVTDGLLNTTGTRGITVAPASEPPTASVPRGQGTRIGTPITFSTSGGNAVSVYAESADVTGAAVQVTLAADNGALTLSGNTGLTFISGTGMADAMMVFVGRLQDVNAALDGLKFTPSASFSGLAQIDVSITDPGKNGLFGLRAVDARFGVRVSAPDVQTPTLELNSLPASPPDFVIAANSKFSADLKPARDDRAGGAVLSSAHLGRHASSGSLPPRNAGISTLNDLLAHSAKPRPVDSSPPAFTAFNTDEMASTQILIETGVTPAATALLPQAAAVDPSILRIAQSPLWRQLNEVDKEIDAEQEKASMTAGAATGFTALLSLGYVIWLMRGASMVASFLATLPVWRFLDPLPVLDSWDRRKKAARDAKKDTDDNDEKRLRSLTD